MSDYIKREDVLTILSGKNAAWDSFEKVRKLPIADVAERRKGQWIKVGESVGALGIVWDELQCSECGWAHSLLPTKFCPNCGADMRGEIE